jgi:Transposase IS116/IS110/IS902 family
VADVADSPAAQLMSLKGIGVETAALLWLEGLFRTFANRRQLAAYAGLAPTPWLSGRIRREQGISKSGNPRLRTGVIELAWLWLRNQPGSALSRWFADRVREEGGRKRRITIVALARKLLVALWKYVNRGEVTEGAALKSVLNWLAEKCADWCRPRARDLVHEGSWCSRRHVRRPNVRRCGNRRRIADSGLEPRSRRVDNRGE